MAFVVSIESLLTVAAIDAMQDRAPRANYNRELVGVGIANVLAGALVLLPIVGVIVRSSANVLAGVQTRLAAILEGAWLLCLVAFVPDLLQHVPVASLGAVLVYTGIKLLNWRSLQILWRADRSEAMIFVLTAGLVVGLDLLEGVFIGFLAAVAKLLYALS